MPSPTEYQSLAVSTQQRSQFIDITGPVQEAIQAMSLPDGACLLFSPHTTAGLTINENADPDVRRDMLHALAQLVPWNDPAYKHAEGNSAAHVKASLLGFSVTVPVRDGRLSLGRWQGIYLCEFDGPRTRSVIVSAA